MALWILTVDGQRVDIAESEDEALEKADKAVLNAGETVTGWEQKWVKTPMRSVCTKRVDDITVCTDGY